MSLRIVSILLAAAMLLGAQYASAEIEKGDSLQTLVNLHPDPERKTLSVVNFQLSGDLIPACTDIQVTKINRKRLHFTVDGQEYVMEYDRNIRKAGIAFQDALAGFFGSSCDKQKMNSLSQKDKDGIKSGTASVGMTKDGVLFAMGPPPQHATNSLDANQWMYWINRFNRQRIEFDDKGVVSAVVN